jgi:hypothetical protein
MIYLSMEMLLGVATKIYIIEPSGSLALAQTYDCVLIIVNDLMTSGTGTSHSHIYGMYRYGRLSSRPIPTYSSDSTLTLIIDIE